MEFSPVIGGQIEPQADGYRVRLNGSGWTDGWMVQRYDLPPLDQEPPDTDGVPLLYGLCRFSGACGEAFYVLVYAYRPARQPASDGRRLRVSHLVASQTGDMPPDEIALELVFTEACVNLSRPVRLVKPQAMR